MTLLIAMGTSALLCDALFELLPTVSGDVPSELQRFVFSLFLM